MPWPRIMWASDRPMATLTFNDLGTSVTAHVNNDVREDGASLVVLYQFLCAGARSVVAYQSVDRLGHVPIAIELTVDRP